MNKCFCMFLYPNIYVVPQNILNSIGNHLYSYNVSSKILAVFDRPLNNLGLCLDMIKVENTLFCSKFSLNPLTLDEYKEKRAKIVVMEESKYYEIIKQKIEEVALYKLENYGLYYTDDKTLLLYSLDEKEKENSVILKNNLNFIQ